jgi:cyclase
VFAASVAELTRGCFAPLAVGGGIRTLEDAERLLNSGADKLVVNTPVLSKPDLVRELVRRYGCQCVVASIDYKKGAGGQQVMVENGSVVAPHSVEEMIQNAQDLGVGEIFLTSIDQDGTGQGYDIPTLERAEAVAAVPVIASGGVGRDDHLAEWLSHPRASAAATANIFNFLGSGLVEARKHLEDRGIPLARWDFNWKG